MDCESILARIEEKIDNLPCANRGERLARIEQQLENGDKQEQRDHDKKTESFGLWRVFISVAGLAILVLQIIGIVK